jgi:hypothetical protein
MSTSPLTELQRTHAALRDTLFAARAAREAKIISALRRLAESFEPCERWSKVPAARYALLHHTLYEALGAAQDKDDQRADKALATWSGLSLPNETTRLLNLCGSTLVLRGEDLQPRPDGFYGSTPYVVTGPLPASRPLPPVLPKALSRVADCDVALFMDPPPGLIVLLDHKNPDEAVTSYTLAGFPATVFTDWSNSTLRLGDSILHESIHCWMNEALKACGENLPAEITVYSPWKDAQRPVFNFLHAVMAFGGLVCYYGRALYTQTLNDWEQDYCTHRLREEVSRLHQVTHDVSRALEFVKTAQLRQLIASLYTLSLDYAAVW